MILPISIRTGKKTMSSRKYKGLPKDEVLRIGKQIAIANLAGFMRRFGFYVCDSEGNVMSHDDFVTRYEKWSRAYDR